MKPVYCGYPTCTCTSPTLYSAAKLMTPKSPLLLQLATFGLPKGDRYMYTRFTITMRGTKARALAIHKCTAQRVKRNGQ